MAVAVARHRGARRFGAGLCLGCPASRVTLAAKRSLQLGFEQFLDEGADAGAHPRLQRIKPVLAEKKRRLSRLRGRGCGICRHGVISAGAPTPVMAWEQAGDYAALTFLPPPRRHQGSGRGQPRVQYLAYPPAGCWPPWVQRWALSCES